MAFVGDRLKELAQCVFVTARRMEREGKERAHRPEARELESPALKDSDSVIETTDVSERASELEQAARPLLARQSRGERLLVERDRLGLASLAVVLTSQLEEVFSIHRTIVRNLLRGWFAA
jgi:hypothetical protein